MPQRIEQGLPGDTFFITLGFMSAMLGGLSGIVAGCVYIAIRKTKNGAVAAFIITTLKQETSARR